MNSSAPNASSPKVGNASAPQGHFYKMRMVRIMDDQGFGQPVEAVRFLIPSDWRTEGGIQWTNEIRCPLNIIQLIFRATSPDGLSAFEFLPSYTWQAASDPQMMQIIQQQAAMGQGCDAGPVANVGEYLQQRIVARARPGARIIARDPLPAVSQAKQAVLMQAYGAMIQAGYVR